MTSRYFLKDNDKEITDMKEQVKAKVGNGADEEQPQQAVGSEEEQGRKKFPKRGKRYSRAQKDEILNFSLETSIAEASGKFDVTETTIYEWLRTDKRRNPDEKNGRIPAPSEDPKTIRDNKILAMWRQHPGYGPSQIRNMLKRSGFRVSVGTVRHVMEENGYLPPRMKRREPAGRYEAARPKELYHLDFYHFYVHKQKTCVLFIEDDFSRFIAGWTITPSESAAPVIECFEQSVQRYGRPEGVMSDRGSAFHSWKGLSRFEALLEEDEINYYLAKKASVNGKVEALNASFQKECVQQTEFMDLTDAARAIGRWVDHYNHRRTHHGLGGLLVPADRFYGIVDQSIKRIEQGLGADTADLTCPDSRGLELFRVISYGGKPQIWLMGEKILG
jgi:transposase InsO family protein